MTKQSDFLSVFQKPIGQNLDNDPDDIRNIKGKFFSLGRYQGDRESGYIDHDLHDALRTYQRDRYLKSDGVIYPGGETEATILGEMIDPYHTDYTQTASVAYAARFAIPWVIKNSPRMIKSGYDKWKAWQGISPSERQDEIEKAYEECYKNYAIESGQCNDVTRKYGKDKGRECFERAAENLALCQKNIRK